MILAMVLVWAAMVEMLAALERFVGGFVAL
jgi:hypothetical protein